MTFRLHSAAERPELIERRNSLHEAWPEFMHHDPVASANWDSLYERFGAFQFFLVESDDDTVVAEGNSLPVFVDLDELPLRGWDDVLERGAAAGEAPNVVTALQVLIDRRRQGSGLSRIMLEHMRKLALEHGFRELVAPVRPSLKAQYPLVPAERYAAWRTPAGLPFDPWLRTHARLGAAIVRVAPESMRIFGTLSEWEAWTGMAFPESGEYVVPGALVPITVDRERDEALYVEPNVWMLHSLEADSGVGEAPSR